MLPISQVPKLAVGAVVAMAMLLAGCLLTPGKFTSDLDVRKDGRFSFAYTGEINVLPLSKIADAAAEEGTFTESTCYSDETGEERKCTADEIKEQKRVWEEDRARSAEKRKQDADSMKAMLGGIDPSSPQAGEEFAARLRRQAGWKKVVYKGDGLFDVDFAIAGKLDHDFVFPTIERFPMAIFFVQVVRRADGSVRIDAPGFGPAQSGEPFGSMLGGMGKPSDSPGMPVIDGKFTVHTDATILANNTDEGPQAETAGKRLDWTVNLRSQGAPTALLKLN